MNTYIIKQKKEKYIETKIQAKSKQEALKKLEEGEFDSDDVLEDEFLLPSSDWDIVSIKKERK